MSDETKLYSVRADGYEAEIRARSPGAAKYELFRRLREAGYFGHNSGGFRAFLERTPTARVLFR